MSKSIEMYEVMLCWYKIGKLEKVEPGAEEFLAQKLSHQSDSLDFGSFGATLVALFFFNFLETFLVFLDFDFLGGAMTNLSVCDYWESFALI